MAQDKDNFSVKEIENFTRKHRFEVFFCLAFVLACFFAFVMYSPWWSMLAVSAGAIIGLLATDTVHGACKNVLGFIHKQEQTTQLILGAVLLIVAIFLSPLIFLLIGLHGGKDIRTMSGEGSSTRK